MRTSRPARSDGEAAADEKPRGSAYDRALLLVARREHSARELLNKLEQRGYDPDESAAAVERLQAQNYQDDTRFGGCLVRQRISDGYGPRWIVAELKTHDIGDEAALRHIAAAAPDWDAVAAAQLRRRYGAKPAGSLAERNKRGQFLLRRGFEVATVRSLTRAAATDGIAGFD